MEAEWIYYAGIGLFAIIGLLGTAKAILLKIAEKKGAENTQADEWAGYLGIGTNALQAIAAALGIEVKSDEPKEVTARKVKAKIDAGSKG